MKLNDKTLAQYYDGELSDRDAAEIRSQIESSPNGVQSLQSMEKLSSYVQIMAEESATSVSFDGFDKRILNEIHSKKRKTPLGEMLGIWFREFFKHRKIVWIPTAALAGAACAALLAIGLTSTTNMIPTMPSSSQPENWQASTEDHPSIASTVAVADSGEMDVTAYNIQTDNGRRIGVVWIND